jgi:hypothetical protein
MCLCCMSATLPCSQVQELGRVVPPGAVVAGQARFQHVCGVQVLTNEAVNLVSVCAVGTLFGVLGYTGAL